ncbi:hypothetical protein NQ317_010437 [Molorchus minor]|uniref:Uncharacterized protein n=1 Tax=Molorchus minor TaxID=1323400 RepID=A0ABQ9JWV5_9CUCU|nr:hypothetical protein NQ317_010437 [Molorchus minor]
MLKQSILIVLILILYVKSQTRHKTVRIYQFKGNCPDHKDAPIQYTDIKLLNVNRTFHISMKVTVRRDIPNGLKGVYVVKNGTFDGSSFDRFSVSNWYWKVKVNVLDEVTGDLLLCAILEGQIAPI